MTPKPKHIPSPKAMERVYEQILALLNSPAPEQGCVMINAHPSRQLIVRVYQEQGPKYDERRDLEPENGCLPLRLDTKNGTK